jgi:hypothetical protein
MTPPADQATTPRTPSAARAVGSFVEHDRVDERRAVGAELPHTRARAAAAEQHVRREEECADAGAAGVRLHRGDELPARERKDAEHARSSSRPIGAHAACLPCASQPHPRPHHTKQCVRPALRSARTWAAAALAKHTGVCARCTHLSDSASKAPWTAWTSSSCGVRSAAPPLAAAAELSTAGGARATYK